MPNATPTRPFYHSVWFALASCGLLLGICLIPAVSALIQAIDLKAALSLNQIAGRSPVFDRFVLLFADEDGRERVVFLLAIGFIIAFIFTPGRAAKSRFLGSMLFIASVLIIIFILDAVLNDIFERKSPSYHLNPFNSIEKILKYKVDLTDRRSFPSTLGIILFTVGFLLLRFGNRRGGWTSLALGLTLPLLLCVAGLNWISDIYLGAFPIAFLVSALAVETPFSLLRGAYVDLAAAGIDQVEKFGRNLVPMWRHRRLYWSSQNVFHMEVATKRFASRELKAIIDPDKSQGHQEVTLAVPLGGLRSIIRIVTLGDKKAVLRSYPVNRRNEADQHFQASNLLADHHVRVPAIYKYIDSPRQYGALFLIEEYVDGRSLEPGQLTDSHIHAAALELARLHNVTSEVWGPVRFPRTEDYGTVQMRRNEKQIRIIERGAVLRGQNIKTDSVRNWFNQWRDELNSIRHFSLVHGKLHRENCIFEESGNFCLLDITTLEWGVATNDLVLVHHSQCGGDKELIRKFDDTYYAALTPAAADQGRRLELFYEAQYCLGQVAKYSKRLRRSQKRQVGDAVTKGTHWWNRLQEITRQP